MRKRIIAGNWKMYKTVEEAKSFVEEVQGKIPVSDNVEAVICPPALYLSELVQLTKESATRDWRTNDARCKRRRIYRRSKSGNVSRRLVSDTWSLDIPSVVNISTKQMNPSIAKSMLHSNIS